MRKLRSLIACTTLALLMRSVTALPAAYPAIAQSPDWHCWNPTNVPDPCYFDLNEVDHYAPGEGWAVGDDGRILRQHAGQWQIVTSPTSENLFDVAAVSERTAWAVGAENTLLRWDGTTWSVQRPPNSNSDLSTITMLSESDGWLGTDNNGYVGSYAEFYRWNGTAWMFTPVASLAVEGHSMHAINDIAMLPNGTAWAVGLTRSGFMIIRTHDAMWFWNGTTWNQRGTAGTISVDLLSDRDGWTSDGVNGYRLTWDAAASEAVWKVHTPGLDYFAMRTATDGWASADHAIRHWNGDGWADATVLPETVYGLSAPGQADAWAVGAGGLLARWDGADWSTIGHNDREAAFERVAVLSDGEAWAVGRAGAIARYDGSAWRDMASPTGNDLSDVSFGDATHGAAVGAGGVLLRFDGASWISAPSPVTASLHAVALTGGTGGWAVGQRGTILRTDGQAWTRVASPTTLDLSDVAVVSETDAWAVGGGTGDGVALRWDGRALVDVPLPTRSALSRVAMVDPNYGWAATQNGGLMNWDGGSWSDPVYASAGMVTDVVLPGIGVGWATTDRGSVLRLTGAAWSVAVSGLGDHLRGIDVDGVGTGWAVGRNTAAGYRQRQLFIRLGPDAPSRATLTPLPSPTLTTVPTRTPLPTRTRTPGPPTATAPPRPPSIYLPALVRRATRDGTAP